MTDEQRKQIEKQAVKYAKEEWNDDALGYLKELISGTGEKADTDIEELLTQSDFIAGAEFAFSLFENQAELVRERIYYHFGKVGGGFSIPKELPFMKEFLKEVENLVNLTLNNK